MRIDDPKRPDERGRINQILKFMEHVFLVYKTDTHHSYASRDIIGVSTSQSDAIEICKQQAEKEGEEISDQEIWNLASFKQTQGYQGKGEFQFEEVKTDTLL